jgi:hypothetical protein
MQDEHNVNIDNTSFEGVEVFKYWGTILVNQNPIQEEIKSSLKSGNAFCLSVQKPLSASLLSKNINIKIYRSIILPVVLYGSEIWSLTLREERRLRVFENRVLRNIFGPKRDEVTGEWRKLHNDELTRLNSVPNVAWVIKSRRMSWAGHITQMGKRKGAYRVLVGKPETKILLGRKRRSWNDNIKMDLQKVEWEMDWIDLRHNRDRWWALVNAVMSLWVI